MNMNNKGLYIIIGAALMTSACSTTSSVPEGDQLFTGLKKINYTNYEANNNFISTQEEVEAALATTPNGGLFGSSYYRTPFPYGLWIWNAFQGKDTNSAKWILKNFGKQPVLMSWVNPALRASVAQSLLKKHGYFHGTVGYETVKQKNPKEAKIKYNVNMGHLFTFDSISYIAFPPKADSLIMQNRDEALIHKNDPFTVAALDGERNRLATLFRNNGYYYYQAGYASYLADTTIVPGKAQIQLKLAQDIPAKATHKWFIGKLDINMRKTVMEELTDSIHHHILTVRYNGKRPPLRPRVILADMKLRPRDQYSYDAYSETMNKINSTGLYSMVDCSLTPRDTTAACDTLDMALNCVFDKPWDAYIETNMVDRTIGRFGPEIKLGVTRRNAFRGGEKLDINLHGNYEWSTSGNGGSMNSYEYGADASIEFPRIIAPYFGGNRIRRTKDGKRRRLFYTTPSTIVKASTNIIQRPGYYKMHVVSGEWTYRWQTSSRSVHEFSPLTLTYQFMNNHTNAFDSIMAENTYLYTQMDDRFIPQMRYTYTYSSKKGDPHPFRWKTTLSEAGNLTSLGYMVFGKKWDDEGKKLFKVEYSQYVKLETEYTKTWSLDNESQLVAHANAGIAYAFGNSTELPFSELFYVGGANSLRAFPVRSLGPGNMDKYDASWDYMLHNGDLKLVLNLEYRRRLFGSLYGAAFIDAGNVWQMKDNQEGEGGYYLQLHPSKLLKQLAVGTGVGIRYDMDFLVLRLDWGIGLHVPYMTSKSGYFNIDKFKDASTINFAIGYPF
jgi:hypothetical protein